jgi:hypothetical protein
LDTWISNDNAEKTNNEKHAQIRLHYLWPHTITIMNENIQMDNAIAESVNDHSWLKTTEYNWNIVESGYKHHNPDPYPKDRYSLQIKSQLIFRFNINGS